ncbi:MULTISPECIES: carbohydrate kinase family protein [Methylobacillus]|uniref:PfkB n=1 Tax=Methylobacillus flagellatus (strain ATCC 51484 / DSM 6875 / VKM B-1610 / KT) TaxID=265072 RepID=Q1H446_METFK|nr:MULTISPECIES: carbohydrate kinase family protein [Methylobacillus]ABE48741.1 PfkB [Methylobacillus flagellatus KT]MPS49393.1 carbohydrate kinase family protein [Methylobacillus sp.]
MRILICGSLAFDTIMVFDDRFKNHILPDKIHMLNVCFLVPEMRREFGGTAGNIAYNLKLLQGDPVIMATVGDDFAGYHEWLQQHQLDTTHIKQIPGTFTAQAFITTDQDNNQLIAFHAGAMNDCHQNSVYDAQDIDLAIIAPDGREGMLLHAKECHDKGIPFMFDPGQGLPMFSGEELLYFIDLATYVAVNDYEAQLLQEKTGLTLEQVAKKVKALIVTEGANGSTIHADGKVHKIPCVEAKQVVDPTGCGDAYRAGLLYGIVQGWDWPVSGRLASVMGAIKIASRGAQNHQVSREEIQRIYSQVLVDETLSEHAAEQLV